MKKIAVIFLRPAVVKKELQKEKHTREWRKGYNSFYCEINGEAFGPGSDSIYGSPQLFGGLQQQFLYS
jgi:hypothetical protein